MDENEKDSVYVPPVTILDISEISPKDKSYFFQQETGEQRRVEATKKVNQKGLREPDLKEILGDYGEDISVHSIKELVSQTDYFRIVILGAPVYDTNQGKTKYESYILKGKQLPENLNDYKVRMIANCFNLEPIERDLFLKLVKLNVPGNITTGIKHFGDFEHLGHIVFACISPNKRSELHSIDTKLNKLISEIGVPPRGV